MSSNAVVMWKAAMEYCMDFDAQTFAENVDYFRHLKPPGKISDHYFYLEYCFVALHAGVSTEAAYAIRDRVWPIINRPLPWLASHEESVRCDLLRAFANQRKVEAMVTMPRSLVQNPGIGPRIEKMGVKRALAYLESLPQIGPVTKYHLARNLGFDVVKPDRHLVRLAALVGTTPDQLCQTVTDETRERIGAVDFTFYQWCAWAGFETVAEQVRRLGLGDSTSTRRTTRHQSVTG